MQINIEHYKNRSLEDITEYVEGVGLITEEWKDVKEYEGIYKCSSFGRIKSIRKVKFSRRGKMIKCDEFIMKLTKANDKYLIVTLTKDEQKTVSVHRLIGIHFIHNPLNKPEINHKRGIKTDNRIWELEWSTKSEQALHRHYVLGKPSTFAGKLRSAKGKMSHKAMAVYCPTFGISFTSIAHASKEMCASKTEIANVCHGKRTQVFGLNFRFL